MSAIQQPTPNHQGETFGSGQTQFFECEALSADHPEIQARAAADSSACNFPMPQRSKPGPHWMGKRKGTPRLIDIPMAAGIPQQDIVLAWHPRSCTTGRSSTG